MKNIASIILLVFISSTVLQAEELKWHTWKEGYEKAIKEDKTMVVFIQTTWCHWCKRMNDKTYNEEGVVSLINKDYIPIKFNPEDKETYTYNGKEYNGMELLAKLTDGEFMGIPATLFLSSSSDKSVLEGGFITAEGFKELLGEHISME